MSHHYTTSQKLYRHLLHCYLGMNKKGYQKSEPADYHPGYLRTQFCLINIQVQGGVEYIFFNLFLYFEKNSKLQKN